MRIPGTPLTVGPRVVAIALLTGSVTLGMGAWVLQSSAASDLSEALEVGRREVPSDDSPPPDLDEYRAILDTIARSVTIRRDIDDLLSRVEDTVAAFRAQRARADDITDAAREDLIAIGRSLAASLRGATTASSGLGTLRTRLDRSAELAAAIARELEELDRSFGPSVGDRR